MMLANLIMILGLVLPNTAMALPEPQRAADCLCGGPPPTCLPPCEKNEVCRYAKAKQGQQPIAYCFED